MNLLIGRFICNKNHEFKAPGLFDYSYGHFFLRSKSRKYIAQVEAIEDIYFNNIGTIVKKYLPDKKNDSLRADIVQYVFGITCDPAPDNTIYRIGLGPSCPICLITDMKDWGEKNPPEYIDIDVPYVTHNSWNKLSENEKEKMLKEEINNYLKIKGHNIITL